MSLYGVVPAQYAAQWNAYTDAEKNKFATLKAILNKILSTAGVEREGWEFVFDYEWNRRLLNTARYYQVDTPAGRHLIELEMFIGLGMGTKEDRQAARADWIDSKHAWYAALGLGYPAGGDDSPFVPVKTDLGILMGAQQQVVVTAPDSAPVVVSQDWDPIIPEIPEVSPGVSFPSYAPVYVEPDVPSVPSSDVVTLPAVSEASALPENKGLLLVGSAITAAWLLGLL